MSSPGRRHVHTRSIRVEAFARDDGLWDLEAELIDTKARDFPLATGTRKAGDPVHEMRLTVTIDAALNVLDATAASAWVPYPGHCDTIGPEYRQLIGLNLRQDFRRQLHERLGGARGCTHVTELAGVLPTAAVQAFAGEVFQTRDSSQSGGAAGAGADSSANAASADANPERKPFQLDRCHALRSDGAAVKEFYPRWYRTTPATGAATSAATHDTQQDQVDTR